MPGGPSADRPQRIADEYGIDSPWYVGRVLAEFPETGADSLVRRAWIDKAFARWESSASLVASSSRAPEIIADIARGGPDMTCVGTMRGYRLDTLEVWNEPDLMATAKRLNARALEMGFYRTGRARPTDEEIRECQAIITVVDVGVGGGVTDRLRELQGRVTPFNGGRTPKASDRYANVRAEAYFTLRDMLQRDLVALSRDEKLAEELMAERVQRERGREDHALPERRYPGQAAALTRPGGRGRHGRLARLWPEAHRHRRPYLRVMQVAYLSSNEQRSGAPTAQRGP